MSTPLKKGLGDYVKGKKFTLKSGNDPAFKMMGRDMGNPRPPRLPLPKSKESELRVVLEQAGLLDFELPSVKTAA